MGTTHELTVFCSHIDFTDLAEAVVDRCRYLLLDFLGLALRGREIDSSQTMLRFALAQGGAGRAAVIGTNHRLSPPWAALVNGTAAHALELDDVVNEASLHPGTVIFPAVLALGQELAAGTGEIITAAVLGYETMVKIGKALNPAAHYRRGFHPTGTCGVFGAAVAAGKLLRLDESQLVSALGIAGSMASGSMEYLAEGAWTKRLHAGWSAHNGIMAARLAQQGFRGPAAILEGRNGFFKAYSDETAVRKVTDGLGEPFEVLRTSIKPHACCRYMQSPIDGVLQIMKEHRLRAADIAKIAIGLLSAGYGIVASPPEAKVQVKTMVDAQFSMPYGAAIAAIKGRAFLDEFFEENLKLQEVKELMSKVECIRDPELDKFYPRRWPAWVRIEGVDGRTYKAEIMFPKGDPENPLTWDELIGKFLNLTSLVLSADSQHEIITLVRQAAPQEPLSRLLDLCSRVRANDPKP